MKIHTRMSCAIFAIILCMSFVLSSRTADAYVEGDYKIIGHTISLKLMEWYEYGEFVHPKTREIKRFADMQDTEFSTAYSIKEAQLYTEKDYNPVLMMKVVQPITDQIKDIIFKKYFEEYH